MRSGDAAFDVLIASVKKAATTVDGSGVVVHTEALVEGRKRDMAIAVMTELAPLVAVSLLAASPACAGNPDAAGAPPVPPALLCLAAGLVDSNHSQRIRLHLQFDSGLVLPIEMPREAAEALLSVLASTLGSQ